LSAEKAALRRIEQRIKLPLVRRAAILKDEVSALYRIAKNIQAKTKTCRVCEAVFIRMRPHARYCSEACRDISIEAARASARECRKQYSQRYRKANPDKRRAERAKRKARIRGAGETHNIDPIKVFDRDGWKCHICGIRTPRKHRGTYRDDAPELEHIVSLADGGSHTWGNVACACRKCNISKGSDSYGQLGFDIAV
jgi:5-methylcytosine-specific restriction endonuclease McrA